MKITLPDKVKFIIDTIEKALSWQEMPVYGGGNGVKTGISLRNRSYNYRSLINAIREKNPDLPILMMTRPEYYLDEDEQARLQVMLNTYNNAIAAGDQNVYYIKGPDLIESVRESALVDGGHPNDSGFVSMAHVVGNKLKEILK